MKEITEIAGDPDAALRCISPVVNADGSTNPEALQKQEEKLAADKLNGKTDPLLTRVSESRLGEIREKIEDPNFSQVDLSKLIAVEMASILEAMNTILDNVSRPSTQTYDKIATKEVVASLGEQLKGVRELGKQISDMDSMAKRDYINFDGDKFRWIIGQWMDLGATALRKMGWEEHVVHNYLAHFREEMVKNQERIRRDADKQVWLEEDKVKKQQAGN